MAFNRYVSSNIGTSATTVYTVGTGVTGTIIGLSVANVAATDITVSVQLNTTYIIKNATVPVGSSLVVVGGDQKLVALATDTIKVTSSAATSADAILSVLEQ